MLNIFRELATNKNKSYIHSNGSNFSYDNLIQDADKFSLYNHYKLDNLVAILDKNNLQQTGANSEIMSVGNLVSKWESFGWSVSEIDGHKIPEIHDTLMNANNQKGPYAIVAHTIKGKGFSFSENNNIWHHAPLSSSQYEAALEELIDGG